MFFKNIVAMKNEAIIKSNTYDSYDIDNVIFKRTSEEFMRFSTGGNIECSKPILPTGGERQSWIVESLESTNNIY